MCKGRYIAKIVIIRRGLLRLARSIGEGKFEGLKSWDEQSSASHVFYFGQNLTESEEAIGRNCLIMRSLVKYLQSIQSTLWRPIQLSPIFFLTYAILLFIPELFTVVAHNRIEYIGGHLFNNFVIYCIVSYFLVLIGILLRKSKALYVIYSLLIHIVLYFYSIGDLFCVKILSTRYTGATLQLIFQTNTKEATGFAETYLFTKPFFQILVFYFLFGIAEFICCRLSWEKVCEIVGGWWKVAVMIYASFVLYISLPYFGENYNLAWQKLNWYAENNTLKDNTLWQLNIGIRKFQDTKVDLQNLLSAFEDLGETTCRFDTSCVVLIIGESYNRHHAHLYGYSLPTTPEMERRNPIVFTDVISPANRTNEAFRNLLSPTRTDDTISWSQAPLFPAFFKSCGYNVTFFSNQFISTAKDESGYDWRSSFYLNHPTLSQACFSHRNKEKGDYDLGLVEDFLSNRNELETNAKDLIIFHLGGQHFNACDMFPPEFTYFTKDSVMKDMPEEWKQKVADYDNATRYNDMVVSTIVDNFKDKDAIVVYFSDHAEEVCDCRNFYGRAHDFEECGWAVMKYQLDVPLLFFVSDLYRKSHQEIVNQLERATQTRFMIDDLPHLMMYLGGIESPWYQDSRNPLSDSYDTQRHRMVSADGEHYIIDYDAH